MTRAFVDRQQAGQALAQRLSAMSLPAPVVVLALPRGGVPVAAQVAKALGAPLDLILVRKIGAPWEHELAVAAVVDDGQPEIVVDEQTRAYGQRCRWRVPPQSSSMTASPPGPPCVPRSGQCVGAGPRG